MRNLLFTCCLAVIILNTSCHHQKEQRETLFQYSTISALLDGAFDGDLTCGELKEQGDFGIGTFNALDGEMIVLDGQIFQVKSDGSVSEADDATKIPFAVVTPFDVDLTIPVQEEMNCKELKALIVEKLPTRQLMYAIKVQGTFPSLTARAPVRATRPYPPLANALKDQSIFEMHDIDGTMVGFWMPDAMQGLNVPGFHFHTLDAKRKQGGHVIDCLLHNARVEIDVIPQFAMLLSGHENVSLAHPLQAPDRARRIHGEE